MESEGTKAVRTFIDSFNKQDHKAHANSLNYPHVRLANGKYMTVESAEQFARMSEKNNPRLLAEGWHHTEINSIKVIHSGDDKEHIALTMDRINAEGTVYNRFDTFWVATRQDDHWGIQFRSSFLS